MKNGWMGSACARRDESQRRAGLVGLPLAWLAFGLALVLGMGAFESVATATDAVGTDVYALIVTNNRSARLGRAELRYADDDGAKYYETFRGIANESNVRLLTEFDHDTEKLFPKLTAKVAPPDRAHVLTAASQLATRAQASLAANRDVEFYFVFAGHGDVADGKGFIELSDGAFDADDLAKLLQSVPATHSHVIADSCNSFFLVNARKPGGQHFATPADAARSMSERLPRVGVFLSTSAEAEVFEWSELQSGVFSHAVRSGLSGAADANGDGMVSYAELRAFVELASASVKNPNYRPQVFARGPDGKDQRSIFDLRGMRTISLDLAPGAPARLTLRDANEVPWVDVHKEGSARMVLRVPPGWASGAIVEERQIGGDARRGRNPVIKRYALETASPDAPVALAQLTASDVQVEMRGPDDMFRSLFTEPFGPAAFAAYEAERKRKPAEVFGVSNDDRERMTLLLSQVADVERSGRHLGGAGIMGVGLGIGGVGVASLIASKDEVGSQKSADQTVGAVLIAAGGSIAVVGGVAFFKESKGEQLAREFRLRLAQGENPQRVVADTETKLFAMAHEYEVARTFARWASAGLVLAGGIDIAAELGSHQKNSDSGWLWKVGALDVAVAGFVFGGSFSPYPVERMAALWKSDPGIQRMPRVTVTPMVSATGVGVAGTF